MTELITMFYITFYILLLKEILKGKVCYLAHLASNPDVPTFWRCMAFICIFILLFICFMCSFESYLFSFFLFSSHIQCFIACTVWGLLHPWVVLWSPPVTGIELDIKGPHFGEWNHSYDSVFCSATSYVCIVDLSAFFSTEHTKWSFPSSVLESWFPPTPHLFSPLWTKVICTITSSLLN